MWLFLRRFFGWYLWLAGYSAVIGALVGMACFTVPFLPFLVVFFFYIFPVALAYAAPLNFIVLPVAFHALRTSAKRRTALRVVGLLGGFLSPAVAGLAWGLIDLRSPWATLWRQPFPEAFWHLSEIMIVFSAVGAIAGLVCARLFDKHGDKPSVFDVNAALDALRKDQMSRG
jgi:hypothetical protein